MAEKLTDSALSDMIREFVASFKRDGRYKYVESIDMMMAEKRTWLEVDYIDLLGYDEITSRFEENAAGVLTAFSRAIREVLRERFPLWEKRNAGKIRVRIADYPVRIPARAITQEHLDRFVSVYGFILKATKPEYMPTEMRRRCRDGHTITTKMVFGVPDEAIVCGKITDGKKCTKRFEEETPIGMIAIQQVTIQDLPNELPAGKLPDNSNVWVLGDLIDQCRPGDKAIVSGVIQKHRIVQGKHSAQNHRYRLQVHANNIRRLSSGENNLMDDSEDDLKFILKMEPQARYEELIKSIAPHIEGMELIKESLLLAMAAHAPLEITDYSRIRWDGYTDENEMMQKTRWDINVFLVGDPGAAKSEMLKFCARVAPRGFYTSGQGSTAVGLTAALIKNPMTGSYEIVAGAMVLGDLGIVCIDEFDKMKPEDRSGCHETMENQTATIAKGGVYAQLNARTGVIAAANPKMGKYDPMQTVYENTGLPIPLLTRFDLIWIIRDTPNRERDTKIAARILKNRASNYVQPAAIGPKYLTKYLEYVKKSHPKIGREAAVVAEDYYVNTRGKESGDAEFVITPRHLESIIRLATARASLMRKEVVDEEDVRRAIHLTESMFQNSSMDMETGKVDLAVAHTGHTTSKNVKIQLFSDVLRGIASGMLGGNNVPTDELRKEMEKTEKFGNEAEIVAFIRQMERENIIWRPTPDTYRLFD